MKLWIEISIEASGGLHVILSTSATHALRALAHLAASAGDQARLGRDLAREVGVPQHYLSKLLATLARAGVLQASRGVRGGYRLARPAAEITLAAIVEPFDGGGVRAGCLLRPEEPCHDGTGCAAHPAWSKVKAAHARFLEGTRLADIQGDAASPPRRRTTSARRGRPKGPGRA